MHVISAAIFSGRRIILPIGERSRLSDVMKERLQAPATPERLSPVFAIATVKKNGFAFGKPYRRCAQSASDPQRPCGEVTAQIDANAQLTCFAVSVWCESCPSLIQSNIRICRIKRFTCNRFCERKQSLKQFLVYRVPINGRCSPNLRIASLMSEVPNECSSYKICLVQRNDTPKKHKTSHGQIRAPLGRKRYSTRS